MTPKTPDPSRYYDIAVDASTLSNPGISEYRGVNIETGEEIFHKGPYQYATNNICEFLALVTGVYYLHKFKVNGTVWTDSKTALSWFHKRYANTHVDWKLVDPEVYASMVWAVKFIREHNYDHRVEFWDTKLRKDIPADFGRKGNTAPVTPVGSSKQVESPPLSVLLAETVKGKKKIPKNPRQPRKAKSDRTSTKKSKKV